MTHLLRVAVVVMFIFCILAGVVLQLMMAAQTTNPRAGNRVLMGLSVDSSEFTEKGPKFRDWRRIIMLVVFGGMILFFVAKGIATAP